MDVAYIVDHAFYVLATVAVLMRLGTWLLVPSQNVKAFQILQIRYFIAWHSTLFFNQLSGPFVSKRHNECGLSQEQQVSLQVLFHWGCAVVSFFSGTVLQKLGHRNMILLCALLIASSHLCRASDSTALMNVATLFRGISVALNRVAFDDWFLHEASQIKGCPNKQLVFAENNAFVSLVLSVIGAPIGDYVCEEFGTRGVFIVAFIGCSVAVILSFIVVKVSGVPESKNSSQSMFSALNLKTIGAPVIVFMLLEALHGVCISVCDPCFSNYFAGVDGLPVAKLASSITVASLLGVQISNLLNLGRWAEASTVTYLLGMAASLATMFFVFDNKVVLFFFVCLMGICGTSANTMISHMRLDVYPATIRGHLLGIMRLLTSCCLMIFLSLTKSADTPTKICLTAMISLTNAVLAVVFIILRRAPPPQKAKTN